MFQQGSQKFRDDDASHLPSTQQYRTFIQSANSEMFIHHSESEQTFCSWVKMLNNDRKTVIAGLYDVKMKLGFFDPSEWLREICRKFPGDVAKMSCSQEWQELTDNMKTWSIWQLKNKTARYLYEQKLFHTVAAHCHIMSLKHIIWLSYLSFASAFFYTNRNFLCCSLILFLNHYLNLNLLPSFPL